MLVIREGGLVTWVREEKCISVGSSDAAGAHATHLPMPDVIAGLQGSPGGTWAVEKEVVLLPPGDQYCPVKEGSDLIRCYSERSASLILGPHTCLGHDDLGNGAYWLDKVTVGRSRTVSNAK
jgi:hypothetical protein